MDRYGFYLVRIFYFMLNADENDECVYAIVFNELIYRVEKFHPVINNKLNVL